MVVFTWNKKGFGLYGFNIPWNAWPGVIGGVIAAEGTRKASGIQSGTSANGILNLTYMVGGGLATYYGLNYLKE
jgi:hypothetical protein